MAATAAALAPVRPPAPEVPQPESAQPSFDAGPFFSIGHIPAADRALFESIVRGMPYIGSTTSPGVRHAALQLALLSYRIECVRRLEFSCFAEGIAALCKAEQIPEPPRGPERARLEARVFAEDAQGARVFSKLSTQERFLTRQAAAALHNLRQLGEEDRMMRSLRASRRPAKPSASPDAPPAPDGSATLPRDLASFSEIASEPAEAPRNAPCPCGSGLKHKRCCGKNAPPHLNRAA